MEGRRKRKSVSLNTPSRLCRSENKAWPRRMGTETGAADLLTACQQISRNARSATAPPRQQWCTDTLNSKYRKTGTKNLWDKDGNVFFLKCVDGKHLWSLNLPGVQWHIRPKPTAPKRTVNCGSECILGAVTCTGVWESSRLHGGCWRQDLRGRRNWCLLHSREEISHLFLLPKCSEGNGADRQRRFFYKSCQNWYRLEYLWELLSQLEHF